MSQADRLRQCSDAELIEIAAELQDRAEQFDAKTRMLINDELRRRKMAVIGAGKSRH